jgi:VWFA-related protein
MAKPGWSVAILAVALLTTASAQQQGQDQTPQFRSSVDVTPIDVTVLDGSGRPVSNLNTRDFTVTIDGQPRRVVDAEWISLATPVRPDVPPPPPGYSTNETSTGGRLIVIVVDQPNIRFGGAIGIRNSVNAFLDRLQPSDRVAAIGIGHGSPSTPFTANRTRVKEAIALMAGQRSAISGGSMREYYVSISEAMAIRRLEPGALERVIARECAGIPREPPGAYEICVVAVEGEAFSLAQSGAMETDMTLGALRALLTALRTINAPKTMVLVSEGFVMDERHPEITELGLMASSARTSIYALKLDDQAFDITRARGGDPTSRFDDRQETTEGMAILANAARGSMFNIAAGADRVFERIESELSGYYLLGVESVPSDADGKAHPIKVQVNRRGVTVRTRREVRRSPEDDRPLTPRQAVMAAMSSPLIVSALPLHVATFSLQGPDPSRVQLLIHAAVGTDYAASRPVAFVYQINDRDGRMVDSLGAEGRLMPVMNGVPSALQYTGSASLPPGEYTMKLAAAEGDRVGTVEHTFRAGVLDAGPYRVSELMVGGPPDNRPLVRPTIGHVVAFGTLHGYIEGYGSAVANLTAKFEIASSAEGPALLSSDVPVQTAGDQRAIFSRAMLVRQLPPGAYVLRALLSDPSGPVKTLTRGFEIAAPAVLMTSATLGTGSPLGIPELYLPIGDELFARPFKRDEATGGEMLTTLRERVAPAARAAFDRGVAHLKGGDYFQAETSFKDALKTDVDSTAVLPYLAATFAAAGHDPEAASAWQTSLIDGADQPQIYAWLADALMRTRDLAQARAVLEEAAKKWPSDTRFAKPLAFLYATFGQGREAVRMLTRHLEEHPDDVGVLPLAVEWTYQLHAAGAVARSRDEDVKLARAYAERYAKTKGELVPLVNQWMEFLDRGR